MRVQTIAISTLLLGGCLTLDALMPFHGPIACSEVTEEDCNKEDPWDAICDTCEAYEEGPWWTREYDWREKTLGDLETIRPVETEVQHLPFTTDDGSYTLDAWYIPSHGEVPELAEMTIIYNHGRHANIEHYAPRVRMLHELGYGVWIWDYRGYGASLPTDPNESPTAPATADWMLDAELAFQQAASVVPDPSRMVVYGMSIGGMPAGEMSDLHDGEICANIYEAAYNSISAKIEVNLSLSMPGSHLTTGLVENEIKLSDIVTPTLILHGDTDDRIHIEEATRLHDALPDDLPKRLVIVEGAGHGLGGIGGVPEQGVEAYGDELLSFFEELAPGCLAD